MYKKNLKTTLLYLLVFTLIVSCTVKKRSYRKGYYVDWSRSKHKTHSKPEIAAKNSDTIQYGSKKTQITKNDEEILVAGNEKSFSRLSSKKTLLIIGSDTCGDIITLRSGEQIIAKVSEVNSELVKYKKCDHLNGPLYSAPKSTILKIKYTNGTEDVFEGEKEVTHNETVTPEKPIPDTTLHPGSILSLILSVLSIFLFFAFILFVTIAFSWGGSTLLFFLSILALLLLIGILVISIRVAKKALKEIKAQPGKYVGEDMAVIAKIMSWVILIGYLVGVGLLLYVFTLYF